MKTKSSIKLVAGLAILLAPVAQGIVGYVNQTMYPGDNLINNALDNSPNLLSTVVPTAPLGTTVSLWNPTSEIFDTTSTYTGLGWTADFSLSPGTGALLNTPSLFTNTWVGTVLHGDGVPFGGSLPLDPPSAFGGPDGTYLLGTIAPLVVTGEDVFLYTLGRGPNTGEKVKTLNASTQIYTTTTYLGSGAWDNGSPSLAIAESAYFVIPEPSTIALVSLFSMFAFVNRRLRY